jgi:hypothetical protein
MHYRRRHPRKWRSQLARAGAVLLRPPTKAALLGFHRTVAEIAVKVAAITGLDNLKAFGNAIHVCVPSVRLRKPGCAGFSAIGTPQIFNPTVEDDNGVQRHVNSLSLWANEGHSKGSTKACDVTRTHGCLAMASRVTEYLSFAGRVCRDPLGQISPVSTVSKLRSAEIGLPKKGISKRSLCR